jgi:hypothetical protein
MVLILFAFAPVNDLVNLLLCGLAVVFFRKPERDRAGQAIIVGAAFLALVLAPVYLPGGEYVAPCGKDRAARPAGSCRLRARGRPAVSDRSPGS